MCDARILSRDTTRDRPLAWLLLSCFAIAVLHSKTVVAQGYPPDEAAAHMSLAGGLRVSLFASEPEVRQPILVKVDDRGRLWTIQYLQYPNPAGLTRVSVDRWSRTVYDRVPEPPPWGPRGADRITILQDTDGDGRADVVRDFVDGLNLATGLAFGHGGVYVLQVPYLLFYPDRDRDDVPDSDPQVLLKGFGMEDAQSLANHLTWGPDGWLYGVNGSTTTCNIRGIEFQQGVWRYHPLRDEFELFCEGGGNTFGLTFDEPGNLFYSTNGGPFVHALQGAYYRKSFGKHGPLHNLYAYGFFEVVERDQVPGGPPTGGTIYLADAFPARLRGTFISGNFLGHTASWWNVAPSGSTFRATYGGVLLDSHDTWFGPTDMCVGPAGEMYVSDFCDQRTAHPDPDANWDRSNGRLYRITADGASPADDFDLAALSSAELVELLRHPNRWYADRARVELAARRDPSVLPALREMAAQQDDELTALQGLWALHISGGFDDAVAETLLAHPSESVRSWTVRLLGDRKTVSPTISDRLTQLACGEKSPVVRCQLAASARRLPAADAVPILAALLDSVPDDDDPRTPWMIWWGIESHAIDGRDLLLAGFDGDTAWSTASRRTQTRLLIRRWAAAGAPAGYAAAERLLAAAPAQQRNSAFAALADGLAERAAELGNIEQGGLFEEFAVAGGETRTHDRTPVQPVTGELLEHVRDYWRESADDADRLRLALLCGIGDADQQLLECIATNPTVAHLQLLLEFGSDDCVPRLLPLLQTSDEALLSAVIQVLGRFGGAETTQTLLNAYPDLPDGLQSQVADVLLRRPGSAVRLLEEVQTESIPKDDISTSQLRVAAIHNDDRLNGLIHQLWGNIAPGTPEEKLATMRRFNNDLRAGNGEPARGKALFTRHCATCHILFGEGGKVGPDLTTANRGDRAALLANIVDPSAVVRREYINYTVATVDGRVLSGLLAEQDAAGITILDAKNQRTRLRRNEIDDIREAGVSLMPERLLEQLSPQELRDLFAYLQQEAAP